MTDPRLNSLHLKSARRQEYRHARDALLHAHGTRTLCAARDSVTLFLEETKNEATCWLSDGEQLYPLRFGVNTIGRSSDNDVALRDAYVSRRHCALLVHSDETCELHDTASKNGTCVNGVRIAGPIILRSGDAICISYRQFIFLTRSDTSDARSSATVGK